MGFLCIINTYWGKGKCHPEVTKANPNQLDNVSSLTFGT